MSILQQPMIFIAIVSIVASAILTILNKVLVNQERVKEIQTKVSAYNKKMMEAAKAKDAETLKQLENEKGNIMQMQSELMKMQMPVFASLLPFFAVFYLLKKMAGTYNWGDFITLPWGNIIPFLGMGDGMLSWLGWYILFSLPFTSLFRRILGVH